MKNILALWAILTPVLRRFDSAYSGRHIAGSLTRLAVLLSLLLSSARAQMPAPLLYYSFEEGSGSTLIDGSGTARNGAIQRGVTFSTGAPGGSSAGNAGLFSNGRVNISGVDVPADLSNRDTNQDGSYTLAAWIKPDASSLVSVFPSGSFLFGQFSLGLHNGIRPNLGGDGALSTAHYGSDFAANTALIADQWVHAVWTYDGPSDTARIYLNGVLDGGPFAQQAPNGSGYLILGCRYGDGGGGDPFNGGVDDVAVWDEVIPLAAILALAAGSSPNARDITAAYSTGSEVPLTVSGFNASGSTVNVALNYAPAAGTTLTVLENTGPDAIQGHFENLADGAAIALSFGGSTYWFVASYSGGDGNDLVLLLAEPVATTLDADRITVSGATLNGTAEPYGLSADAWFEYGTTTNYGSVSAVLDIGTANTPVAIGISGLTAGVNYYFRLVVSTSAGMAKGAPLSFVAGQAKLTSELATGRHGHTATLLNNGKVLVVGGVDGAGSELASAELYDPTTGGWISGGNLATGRRSFTSTLLSDGKVLVTGGYSSTVGYLASAELYDPVSGTWTNTGNLVETRLTHTATLLDNGKVLIAGGSYWNGLLPQCELYDPSSGGWSYTGSLANNRENHTATLLSNGEVLVSGGSDLGTLESVERYDPINGTWSSAAALATSRSGHTATRLDNGTVLAAGGNSNSAGGSIAGVELYNGAWTGAASLLTNRSGHSATLLEGGNVLIAGGGLASTELYDTGTDQWYSTPSLLVARSGHTATRLDNGQVLIVGGRNSTNAALASAELYCIAVAPTTPFSINSATTLVDGTFQVGVTNTPGASFSVYGTTNLALPLNTWSNLGSMVESPAGQFLFTDPQATNSPQRFYRVTSP